MNKHTAKYENHSFKRNSENRVYTHLVLGLRDLAVDRARRLKDAQGNWDDCLEYVQQVAAGTDKYAVGKYADYIIGENGPYGQNPYFDRAAARASHDARALKAQAEAAAKLAAGRDAFIAAEMAAYGTRIANASKTADGKYMICELGWAGRPDLADKLANRALHVKYYAKRVVLPAQVVIK